MCDAVEDDVEAAWQNACEVFALVVDRGGAQLPRRRRADLLRVVLAGDPEAVDVAVHKRLAADQPLAPASFAYWLTRRA